MVTVSHAVKSLIEGKTFILEPMSRNILSYAMLARHLQPEVQRLLKKPVRVHAIEMALRRYAEQLSKDHHPVAFNYTSDVIMKTKICDISVARSVQLQGKIKKLYDIVKIEKGDLITVIQGSTEVSIATNERYRDAFLKILSGEKILNVEGDLVSLTMTFSKEFLYTPGVVFTIIRNLAWESINLFEIISTTTELTVIISEKDAMLAYHALERLIQA